MFKDIFKNMSFVIGGIPLLLTLIGLVFCYSSGINPGGGNSGLYIKQLIWVIVGLVIAFIILNFDYNRLVEMSHIFFIIGILLLVITLVFGKTIRGSRSWLGIAGLGMQASEIMKVFFVLFLAKYLSNAPVAERKNQVFLMCLGILMIPLGLIMLQPDLGTGIVFIVIFLSMCFMGLADDTYIKYIIYIALSFAGIILSVAFYKYNLENGGGRIGFIEAALHFNTLIIISGIALLYSLIAIGIEFFNPIPVLRKILPVTLIIGLAFFGGAMAVKVLKPYQWKRLLVMISPEFDRAGAGYNIIQSKIAIGSGGLLGKGLFRGTQNKLGFLPEKSTDFIYSIISEELGFVGSAGIIGLFLLYFFYIIRTIQNSKDKDGMLVATGLLAMFGIHFIINIGMALGVTPVTGLPLPFISYGGSSYIAFIMAAALVANIYVRRFVH